MAPVVVRRVALAAAGIGAEHHVAAHAAGNGEDVAMVQRAVGLAGGDADVLRAGGQVGQDGRCRRGGRGALRDAARREGGDELRGERLHPVQIGGELVVVQVFVLHLLRRGAAGEHGEQRLQVHRRRAVQEERDFAVGERHELLEELVFDPRVILQARAGWCPACRNRWGCL